ncbi:MAG: nitric oxide reductase [Nitrospiraceae bacterium]
MSELTSLLGQAFALGWSGGVVILALLLYFQFGRKNDPDQNQLVLKAAVGLLGYSVLCIAIVNYKQHFFDKSYLLPFSLAMIAAVSFMMALYFEKARPLLKTGGIMFLVAAALSLYGHWFPQVEGGFGPPKVVQLDVYNSTPQQLADEGEKIIFGGLGQSKVQGAIGRGQCPLCHGFMPGFLSERAPNLFGITDRARERLKDPRYHLNKPNERDTVQKEAFPGSGTATTALEYIAESLVCDSCYVVSGYGRKGMNDTESPGEPPYFDLKMLSIDDMVIVVTWLYIRDGKTPPPPGDIEMAFKRFIPEPRWSQWKALNQNVGEPSKSRVLLADGTEPVDEIFSKGQCISCHIIPGIPGAIGTIGPKLTMKSVAQARLKDTTYKGKARTVREYVTESILHPSDYVVKNFPDNIMPRVYGQKLSGAAIDKMVNYLSQLEEGKAPPKID